MANKIIGYVLIGIGLVLLVANLLAKTAIQKATDAAKLPFITQFFSNIIYIGAAALVLIVVGAFFLRGSGSVEQAAEEVPIYQGNKIVGYRKA